MSSQHLSAVILSKAVTHYIMIRTLAAWARYSTSLGLWLAWMMHATFSVKPNVLHCHFHILATSSRCKYLISLQRRCACKEAQERKYEHVEKHSLFMTCSKDLW